MLTLFSGSGDLETAGNWSNGLPDLTKDAEISGDATYAGTVASSLIYKTLRYSAAGKMRINGTETLTLRGGAIINDTTGTEGTIVFQSSAVVNFEDAPTVTIVAGSFYSGGGEVDGFPNYVLDGTGELFNSEIDTIVEGNHGTTTFVSEGARGGLLLAGATVGLSMGAITCTAANGPASSVVIESGYIILREPISSNSNFGPLLKVGNGAIRAAGVIVLGAVTKSGSAASLLIHNKGWVVWGDIPDPGDAVSYTGDVYGAFSRDGGMFAGKMTIPRSLLGPLIGEAPDPTAILSRIVRFFIADTSQSDGSGLAGVTPRTEGLELSASVDTDLFETIIPPVDMDQGEWVEDGWCAETPVGWYSVGLRDVLSPGVGHETTLKVAVPGGFVPGLRIRGVESNLPISGAVSLTWEDASGDAIDFAVYFTVVGQGSGRSSSDGTFNTSLANGTYTIRTTAANLIMWADATLTVSGGTGTLVLTGQAVVIPDPPDPNQVTAVLYTVDYAGNIQIGVTVYLELVSPATTGGLAYDGSLQTTLTSNADGLVVDTSLDPPGLYLKKGCSYHYWRDTGPKKLVAVGSMQSSPLTLDPIVG